MDMDYGRFLSLSLEVGSKNIAHKGIAVRLDPGIGGVAHGEHFAVFDTDTLRLAAMWSGKRFVNWRSILFDGSHQTHSRISGPALFTNPNAPGWGEPGTGSFKDVRFRGRDGVTYGPIKKSWGNFKGLYLHNESVVFNYSVGETQILESPGLEGSKDHVVYSRTLNIGPRSKDLILQVAQREGMGLSFQKIDGLKSQENRFAVYGKLAPKKNDDQATLPKKIKWDGSQAIEIGSSKDFDFFKSDYTIFAKIKTKSRTASIFSRGPKNGRWAMGGMSFFIKGGSLHYDMGYVGAVRSRKRVSDGEWHDVAMTFEKAKNEVTLYVDGKKVGQGRLQPKEPGNNFGIFIGHTSNNFPGNNNAFKGEMAEVGFYNKIVEPSQLLKETKAKEGLIGWWKPGEFKEGKLADLSGKNHGGKSKKITVASPNITNSNPAGFAVLADLKGVEWIQGDGGALRLKIPAGKDAVRLKVLHTQVKNLEAVSAVSKLIATSIAPTSLSSKLKGGRRQWYGEITSEIKQEAADPNSPYVTENFSLPLQNPYSSWMRVGGFDFFKDANKAALCTWMGDVWLVEGVAQEKGKLKWKRIATGLYQPLGLKIRNEEIFVLGRDQITRLHDLNGDLETDYYESFNHDFQASEHFHEFAMDLQTDKDGNFYFMKGARHALDSNILHHGTLLKVSKDGSKLDVIAKGFRAPNGLCVNPDGSFLTSDQEGHWTPANRINWVEKGGFYGYMFSYLENQKKPTDYDRPLCWIDPEMDRSPAAQLWVEGSKWGLPDKSLINLSYGTGYIYQILHEKVDGQRQGGVVRLPIKIFPTGIMRGRFHPENGQLYLSGLFGWASNRPLPGGFYRVRYTGKDVQTPLGLHATDQGLILKFNSPVDAKRSGDPRRYQIKRWNYKWQSRYGSDDWKLSDGKKGRDTVKVDSVQVSDDGKSIFLKISDMAPCMQMSINYRISSASGQRLSHRIYHTIHKLGKAEPHLKDFK